MAVPLVRGGSVAVGILVKAMGRAHEKGQLKQLRGGGPQTRVAV